MANLTIQRVPFGKDSDNRMRALKGRTQITPNLFCRLGFNLSLEERGVPPVFDTEPEEIGREINRNTLLGEYEAAFLALLAQWMHEHGLDPDDEEQANRAFVDHMNRGAELIASRLKGISDLPGIIPKSQAA
jgi:DNA sulfur modification protein DndE